MVQAELHNKDKIQMVTLKAKLLKPKLKTSKAKIEQKFFNLCFARKTHIAVFKCSCPI